MGAMQDTNEKAYFLSDAGFKNTGATINGTPAFLLKSEVSPENYVELGIEAEKSKWLVCPHLLDPHSVYSYYMSSGLITIVMGKCFCETCLDMILNKDDINDFLRSSLPMTDELFQSNIVEPLLDSNYHFTRQAGFVSADEQTPKTWITCSHFSDKSGLLDIYAGGGQIFIFEGYFTCQDCFDKIPTYSLVDVLYEGKSMTDEHFQKKVIDPLYVINYESLKALGHFGCTLT
jgi:hypothetical protein